MSFPGRTPMAMPGGRPGMPPRMINPGYAFASMGMTRMNPMMPMQMGMMTPMMQPMMQPQMQMHPQQQQQQQQQQMKPNQKFVPQDIPKNDPKGEKPPVTTVFVGNISDRAPDMMIKQMLQRCGNVLSWKRVQGASGKLQAFGFCEYEDPEATLRCIRLLNDWHISRKNLVVKVDAKTKTLLDEYRKKKQEEEPEAAKKDQETSEKKENGEQENGEEKEKGEIDGKEESEEKSSDLDENTQREDRVAQAGLEAIMREYAFELNKEPVKPSDGGDQEKEKQQLPKKDKDIYMHAKDTGFDDMEMEDEKREIINREINKFRDRHKDADEEKAAAAKKAAEADDDDDDDDDEDEEAAKEEM